MKLAIICRPFSFHGGVETATAGLMTELLQRGHAVHLLSTTAQADVPGVTVRRLRVPAHPSLLRFAVFALAAQQAVAHGHHDVVQSHERCLSQDIYRAGEGTHRGYLAAMGRSRRIGPYHRLVCAFERRIFTLRAARHIVAISRRDKVEIQSDYATPGHRVSLVYNGVDLERFHPDNRDRHRSATRAALGLSATDWLVLFVGSGFERKGLGPLIQALADVRDPACRLVVAGKGRRDPYERLVGALGLARRVTWLGPRPDIERLYAMADVVALPALYEPFGNVHLEALASGVPVLASRYAGGSEVIGHGDNGWIVPEPRPAQIATGLEAIRSLNPEHAASSARKAAEPFTHAAQVDALTKIYRALQAPTAE